MHIRTLFKLLVITTKGAKALAGHLLAHAITAARKTDPRRTAMTIVQALGNSALNGPAWKAQAIEDAGAYVLGFIGKGGFTVAEADVEMFASALIEAVLFDRARRQPRR